MMKLGKRVLLVDDEQLIVKILKRYLEREGFSVVEANSRTAALDAYHKERPFHALLCDVHLGRDSGWEVAEEIYLAQPSIRVLMISGAISFGVTPAGLPYRMLQKPFTQEDLKESIRKLWRDTF